MQIWMVLNRNLHLACAAVLFMILISMIATKPKVEVIPPSIDLVDYVVRDDRMPVIKQAIVIPVKVDINVGRDRPTVRSTNVAKIRPPRPRLKPVTKETPVEKKKKSINNLFARTVSGNGGRVVLDLRTAEMFVELERRWGETLNIRWAYRDRRLNREVGGKEKSYHLLKMAVDVRHDGWPKAKMKRFVRLAYSLGFRGFGLGQNVVHIDSRKAFTSWNYGNNPYGLAYSMVK